MVGNECLSIIMAVHRDEVHGFRSAIENMGIGTLFCVQTFINVGSASGGIPTKGLTLPLVSYGGSSMISCCMAIAILLRIDFEWRNNAISDKRKNES